MAEVGVGANAFEAARMVVAKVNFILEKQCQMYIDDGLELLEVIVLARI